MNLDTHRGLTRDEMERRRLSAAQDLPKLSQAKIASKYGVSRMTASRWARQLTEHGPDALRKTKAPGRPYRLNPLQLDELGKLCRRKLTASAIALIIERRFGVHYHPDHVCRLRMKFRKGAA